MNPRVLTLTAGNFAVGTGGLVLAGILPLIARDTGVAITTAGQLVTVFALTYAVGAPVLATLTAAAPRRALMIAALLIFAAGNGLVAVAPDFGTLTLARVVAALGAAMFTPTASAVAVALVPREQRGRALALVIAGLSVATVLGVPLGTLLGQRFGWRLTFAFVALSGVLAAAGVRVLLPTVATPPAAGLRTRLALLRQGAVVGALAVTMLVTTGQFAVYTYLASLLEEVTGLGEGGVSAMLLLFGAASVVGSVLGGWGTDRWGVGRTLVAGIGGLTLALFALSPAAGALPFAALVVAGSGVAGWVFSAPQQYRLLALAPDASGIVLSLNQSALYTGVAAGAALGGLVLNTSGVSSLGWVAGLVVALALGVALLGVALAPYAPAAERVPARA